MSKRYSLSSWLSKRAQQRLIRMIAGLIIVLVVWAVEDEIIWFTLNIMEFGDLYIRPIYFSILGGLILAPIVFFRVDFKHRRSITWWALRLAVRVIRERGAREAVPPNYLDFKVFRMPKFNFMAWQITKVVIGMLLLRDMFLGMAVTGMAQGWNPHLDQIWEIFTLPFVVSPSTIGSAAAQATVIPLLPALTLVVKPVLWAMGVRLILLVGVTEIIRVATPSVRELDGEQLQFRWRVSIIEALIAIALFWSMVNVFFSSYIDYNTKYAIGGLGTAGVVFALFAYMDRAKGRGLRVIAPRPILTRFIAIIIIVLVVSSIMAINHSIADARKVEWRGPYTLQQITVNRELAELAHPKREVREIPYDVGIVTIPRDQMDVYVSEHRDLLDKIRLWDRDAAFAKKPEIGPIPYLDYEDSDIIRFRGNLYWSASMKLVLPPTVLPEDEWYNEHLVYTHAPIGFLLLDGHEGVIVDTSQFFKQRKIYYGEGGLFREVWAAYPLERSKSDELGGHFYDRDKPPAYLGGKLGGLDIPPPLSWLFDFIFFLSYRDKTIHVLRYRDVYDRMSLLFPYFVYEWGVRRGVLYEWAGKRVDMLPVTDGERTYYLMPLIVGLDTGNVPWSVRNPFMRLVGYALLDIYNGSIKLIVLGDDYFSDLFRRTYSDYITTEVPDWLEKQLRYPKELFKWRVEMYNTYHVTDPRTFIEAKEFLAVPEGLDTYYIMAQPPNFDEPEFVGLLSLERRGAITKNLVGYIVVRNDWPYLGEMLYYRVAEDAPIKLLGPSGAIETLEKDPDFRVLRTLLRDPRVGDNILYRVGEHDVYFIPIYTAPAAGEAVITALGKVACVGAYFTAEYYVGLGNNSEDAFRAFLTKLPGAEQLAVVEEKTLEERMDEIVNLFKSNEVKNMTVVKPEAISPDVTFHEGETVYISQDQWNSAREMIISFIRSGAEMWTRC